jgi:ribosome-binding factor A
MNNRRERLAELLQAEISSALVKARYGGFPGIITITCVKVSPSLEDATVYYSALGTKADKEAAARVFQVLRHDINTVLCKRVTLRRMPKLAFKFDPTPAQAARVESILKFLQTETKEGDENPQG